MPELPEVHTTATMLDNLIVGLKIKDIWNGYNSPYFYGKDQVKNPKFFKKFKNNVVGAEIKKVQRRGKNILIFLNNDQIILIHMKMTGHLLHGKYSFNKKTKVWEPKEDGPLQDKFNGWIRFVFSLSDGKHLAFSDLRKFGKITLFPVDKIETVDDLKDLGPEPFDIKNSKEFFEILNKRPQYKIKQALMDQTLLVGVGNIYSDEALWLSKIHPETLVCNIPNDLKKDLFINTKKVLKKGINFGGDSMSDYRRPDGLPGQFQTKHNVYQRKNKDCKRKNCDGTITRIVVAGRSSHYCPICQRKSKFYSEQKNLQRP